MAKPIKRSLLIHEVTYQEYQVDNSGWGGDEGSYGNPITVRNVRVEQLEKLLRSSTGDSVVYQNTLFWDAYHSTPIAFKQKDKVIFNGTEYTVESINTLYDGKRIHHLEIVLK
ncbi:minor capsid protein [Bacillus cereus]|uniref:putative minor capsid protein n=1 Tax=Bacillus cereus TaxID=1396 RepID=UPI001E63D2D4|nr:putative minor capsid protein [Bacillus cereus]MCC2397548.1 minor capsid protein [Bacillus cereus]